MREGNGRSRAGIPAAAHSGGCPGPFLAAANADHPVAQHKFGSSLVLGRKSHSSWLRMYPCVDSCRRTAAHFTEPRWPSAPLWMSAPQHTSLGVPSPRFATRRVTGTRNLSRRVPGGPDKCVERLFLGSPPEVLQLCLDETLRKLNAHGARVRTHLILIYLILLILTPSYNGRHVHH